MIPLSAMGLWFSIVQAPKPLGIGELILHLYVVELALASTLFFGVGFLWAISGNRRLKSILDGVAVKFAWLLFGGIALPLAGAVICGMLRAACIFLFGFDPL